MATVHNETRAPSRHRDRAGTLGAVGWGLFITWIGIVFLARIDAWIALLGVGAITLGVQALRKAVGLAFEGIWVVVGLVFVVGALWDLSGTTVSLFPILMIAAGLALLLSTLWHQHA